MMGHKICFNGKIWKIIPVTPSYLEHWLLFKDSFKDFGLHGSLGFNAQQYFSQYQDIFQVHLRKDIA